VALGLFVWRGVWMWRGQPSPGIVWRRILPDSIDTLLLLSGVCMAVILDVNPLEHEWLLVKLLAVMAYIGLGMMALHPGGRHWKKTSFVAALMIFGYITTVAHSKQAWF